MSYWNGADDLAHKMIFAQNARDQAAERFAETMDAVRQAKQRGFSEAADDLEHLAMNLRGFMRGVIGVQLVPHYIAQARAALDRMEGAL